MNLRVRLLVVAMLWVVHSRPVLGQETALAGLREAANQAPADIAAQSALGHALIEAGRLGEAATQMNSVVKLSKGSIEALFEARRVDFAVGNYKKVRSACRELSAKDPKHALSQVCMARALLVWRRASPAFEFIDKALAADPQNYEALLAQADAKLLQGDVTAAVASYEQAAAQNPKAADALLGLGQALGLAKDNVKALAALRKALSLSPTDPDIQLELGRRVSGQEAAELMKRAVSGRPNWPEAQLELAGGLLRIGDAAGAETQLQAIFKATPDHPLATARHGAALVALGRFEEAEPALKRALELIPNDFETSFALAKLYEQTNRSEEAFTQYRGAADLKRENPAPLIAAARLGLSLKRTLLCGALLDKALERAPRSAEALALYGEVAAQRGDTKAARDFLQRALQGEGALDTAGVRKRLTELK